MRLVRKALAVLATAGALILAVLLFPQPLFAYSLSHGPYRIWSDRPIDPAMVAVLDDANRRLRTSDLHDPRAQFRIFICNAPWRLWLFSRSTAVGGAADAVLSRNIYLREADIAGNRLIPPEGVLADADVRTLAYFIAHEATHVMQSRAFGRLMEWRYPDWLTEGYADWVAKAGQFDYDENRRLLAAGDPRLDYARSGLSRRYHLMVAFLIERRGQSIGALFRDPPAEAEILANLAAASPS